MTEDQFKCLVFVCSLRSREDADILTRILSKPEHCVNITLLEVTSEYRKLVNLNHDTSIVGNSYGFLHVHAVERKV
ncbi:uncharacterized protein DC041_0004207 [Schistosoma bovis]|uniref:Uncharacterized protein n=1 Tax=Schistosoma bovis TaxID=6184 RepID=A0A430QQK2_SCHBO|nr:uncharacterized protein DC041_0004207 [Schistosoma bovis]